MLGHLFQDRRILVAVDEHAISRELCTEIMQVGGSILGPIWSMDDLLDFTIHINRIDGAVLSVNLDGEPTFAAANHLLRRGIRFVFIKGHNPSKIPDHFDAVVQMRAPLSAHEIMISLV